MNMIKINYIKKANCAQKVHMFNKECYLLISKHLFGQARLILYPNFYGLSKEKYFKYMRKTY